MIYKVTYTDVVIVQLRQLHNNDSIRIVKKLGFYASSPNPLTFAKKLTNFDIAEWRFRVGSFRILFDLLPNG